MQEISINDLYEVTLALDNDGYKLLSIKNGIVTYAKGKEILEVRLYDDMNHVTKTLRPNYDNSLLTIDASIRKFFGKRPNYKTNETVDELLSSGRYKHVVLMLLDGLGSAQINDNLAEDAFLKKHKVKDISAIFPSTTTAAITALESGKEPLETGWLGWDTYVKELDKHIVLFKDSDYFTGEKLDFNAYEYLKYSKFYQNMTEHLFKVTTKEIDKVNGATSFKEACSKVLTGIKSCEASFTYMYWNEPDYTMHEYGSASKEAKIVIKDINDELKRFKEAITDDTLVIITSDHGHIDCNPIYLYNFTGITDNFQRVPSNEGRATFFKIRPFAKGTFVRRFKRYFGSYFRLMTKYEFIVNGYLGKNILKTNPKLLNLIGDYVAIATKNYYFNYDPRVLSKADDTFTFKSHHAGLTENEMVLPLIIIKK